MVTRRGFIGALGTILGAVVVTPLSKLDDWLTGPGPVSVSPDPPPDFFDLNDDAVIEAWERELMRQVTKRTPLVSLYGESGGVICRTR